MDTKPKIVKFNNQQVPVFFHNEKPYVVMKPICENIGLDWRSQLKRIKRNQVLNQGVVMMTTPSVKGDQDSVALPLGMLNGWLMGVDANKVRPEIKDTLIKYQLECYDVLYQHFMPKPRKPVDLSAYVRKDAHEALALKYHCMFRQYDDMIDDLRDQVSRMENKCRRYNFKMHVTAIPIDVAAKQFHTTESHLKRLLVQEGILEERDPYIEINKKVLTLTKRGQQLELVFLKSDIVNGDVQDIIMVTEDGLSYLSGMLDK